MGKLQKGEERATLIKEPLQVLLKVSGTRRSAVELMITRKST